MKEVAAQSWRALSVIQTYLMWPRASHAHQTPAYIVHPYLVSAQYDGRVCSGVDFPICRAPDK